LIRNRSPSASKKYLKLDFILRIGRQLAKFFQSEREVLEEETVESLRMEQV
jgi:hypothetical protein